MLSCFILFNERAFLATEYRAHELLEFRIFQKSTEDPSLEICRPRRATRQHTSGRRSGKIRQLADYANARAIPFTEANGERTPDAVAFAIADLPRFNEISRILGMHTRR